MDDYIIDAKLLRDVKEIINVPTPYPERLIASSSKKNSESHSNNTNHNINYGCSSNNNHSSIKGTNFSFSASNLNYNPTPSSIATITNANTAQVNPPILHPSNNQLKKEMSDLESKYFNLMKLFEKSQKKSKETIEESKRLKMSNDSLMKEYSLIQKTIERINAEKSSLSSQLEENKAYTRKLETRIVSGAKNQNLIEINNKLRTEIEELNTKLLQSSQNQDNLIIENGRLTKHMETMERALLLKAKEMNLNNPDALLSYAESIERNNKATYEITRLTRDNESMKKALNDLNGKIQELSFAKEHLTELLAEKASNENNLQIEKKSYETHYNQLIKEKEKMKEYIEHIQQEHSDRCDEANSYIDKINELQKELDLKERDMANYDEMTNTIKQYHKDNEELKEMINELNDQRKLLDEEKMKLIKENEINIQLKMKEIEELKKLNEEYYDNESKFNEEIKKYQTEIVIIQQERDKFKKCLNDFATMPLSSNENNNMSNNQKSTIFKKNNVDYMTIQQQQQQNTAFSTSSNSMLDLVRKEKEKNKNILDEIKRLQEKK